MPQKNKNTIHKVIYIDRCSVCPHVGKTNSYTLYGPLPVCKKVPATDPDVNVTRQLIRGERPYRGKHRVLPWALQETSIPGKYSRVSLDVIPEWCPLETYNA